MRFLTNLHKDKADRVIDQLCMGWNGRVLVIDEPRASETIAVEDMKSWGMIGIYEIKPGVAVS